ncbi:prevent-host-death family protein [Phyllobacterium sp. OV277]|nr:prevent-host-death family protein [Phyllobacterium sp. OV277]
MILLKGAINLQKWSLAENATRYNMTIGSHIGVVIVKEAQLKDVKATFSAIVDRAVAGEPTVVTRHGRKEAVVLSFEEYERLSKVPSFGELLAAFPGETGDVPERSQKPSRSYSPEF